MPDRDAATMYLYGPFWQAECDICHTMSDCFDSEKEREEWTARHDCGEVFARALPLSAKEAGWNLVVQRPKA